MAKVNYVEFTVRVARPRGRYADPERLRKEIETHVRIRVDPDYEEDVEVTIDEIA